MNVLKAAESGHFKMVTFIVCELNLKKFKKKLDIPKLKVKDILEALSDYLNGFDRKSVSRPLQDI